MTNERKVIRAKVGVLELAKQLGNVSQACKIMGYSDLSFIWPLRTSIILAPRPAARRPTASASASTRRCCTSSTRSRSASASMAASSNCRPTSMSGLAATTSSARTRAAGATARPRCRPSLTPRHSQGRRCSAPPDRRTTEHRSDTKQARLSDQILATTSNFRTPAPKSNMHNLLIQAILDRLDRWDVRCYVAPATAQGGLRDWHSSSRQLWRSHSSSKAKGWGAPTKSDNRAQNSTVCVLRASVV